MEEDMEVELVFEARDIDLDYEYDAAMFFDFTREESTSEAGEAERWFDMAPSCPPSPFVRNLPLRDGSLLDDVSTSSSKCVDGKNKATFVNDDDSGGDLEEHSVMEVHNGELTTANQIPADKSKSRVKGRFPSSSTLMKPTASLLAKQNQPLKVGGSRIQMPMTQKDRSLCNASVVETQATKRQKLEGGHLCKVGDAKLQTDFLHKTPKKDGLLEKSTNHSRLRLTIPREPELETARRAERTRPRNNAEMQHMTAVVRKFKARPLNRKILEAPSLPIPKKSTPKLPNFQEFHLKTSERAKQYTAAVSFSSLQGNDSDKGLDTQTTSSLAEPESTSTMDFAKHDVTGTTHLFKAHPLKKKIFSSRGDIGVFRNHKHEATIPTEFNFHTEKRIQYHPPSELFSKLSLRCELQQSNGPQLQFPRPSSMFTKGSKENRLNPMQPENMMAHLIKERSSMFDRNRGQIQNDGSINEVGSQLNMRNIGVR